MKEYVYRTGHAVYGIHCQRQQKFRPIVTEAALLCIFLNDVVIACSLPEGAKHHLQRLCNVIRCVVTFDAATADEIFSPE